MTRQQLIDIILARRPVERHRLRALAQMPHAELEGMADLLTAPMPDARTTAKAKLAAFRRSNDARVA